MTTNAAITFRHHDSAGAGELIDEVVVPVYEASHADVRDTPSSTTARFLDRLRGYMERDGFELVVADAGEDQPVGLTFGYALPPTTRWWDGLITPVPEGLIAEDGQRTFALAEIMVLPGWRRRGIARSLHDELMSGRHEQRATLLASPDNVAAQSAYAQWGWRKVAQLKPFPDSPVHDALILRLRPE